MTDPAAPETPDVAETVSFLRRFADLMANGYNGSYLRRAADLLESLTQHADALETECDSLKSDIEGHLDIASSLLAERETLVGTLQAREAERAGLGEALSREQDQHAAKSAAHEQALNEVRSAFDQKREALQGMLEARVEQCDQLRRDLDRERGDSATKLAARESELSELRLAFDHARDELQVQLKARGDELAMLRMVSEREHDALRVKVAALEAKRVELRSVAGAETVPLQALPSDQEATGEAHAIVPKTTLRQARAQFEFLAREFIPLGDIASQVMCELGAYKMDLALLGGRPNDHLPVGEVARSILAPVGSNRT